MSNYAFYLKPLDEEANEELARILNSLGESAASLECQEIVVDGKTIYGVYMTSKYRLITRIRNSSYRNRVKVYEQKDGGEIDVCYIYHKKKRSSRHIKAAKKRLAKMKPKE